MATFTETQNKELNEAFKRVESGAPGAATDTNAGDVANLAFATDRGFTPTVADTTQAESLTTTPPPVVQPEAPVDETASAMAGFTNTLAAATDAAPSTAEVNALTGENKELFNQFIDTVREGGGQGTALVEAERAAGIPEQQKKLAGLNERIALTAAEFDKSIEELTGSTGLTTTIQGKQGQLQRQKAVLVGGLSAQAQAIQGNIAAAQATAKRTVDLEFQDAQQNIDIAKAQLEQNYESLTKAEKKQADEVNFALDQRQRQLDEQKEEKGNILNLMLKAAENGADERTLELIRNSKTLEDAIGNSRNFLSSPQSDTDFGVIGQRYDENAGVMKNVYGFIDKNTRETTAIDGSPTSSNFDSSSSAVTPGGTYTANYSGGVPGGITGNVVESPDGTIYDIGSYATQDIHEDSVRSIVSRIGKMNSVEDMDSYIQSVAPDSEVTGQMIANASGEFGVSWEIMMAMMQQDSNFADPRINSQGVRQQDIVTGDARQRAVKFMNPGNQGNVDSGANVGMSSWQEGVNALASNMNHRIVSRSAATETVDPQVKSWSDMMDRGEVTIKDIEASNKNLTGKLVNEVIAYRAQNGTISEGDAILNTKLTSQISDIQRMIDHFPSYGSGAVGTNPLLRISGGNKLAGRQQEFVGIIHQLMSQKTLQELLDLKKAGGTLGALSEKEADMLSKASTKLGDWEIKDDNGIGTGEWDINEAAFKRELKTLGDLTGLALKNAAGSDGTVKSLEQSLASNPERVSDYNIIMQSNPGLSDEEVMQVLGL